MGAEQNPGAIKMVSEIGRGSALSKGDVIRVIQRKAEAENWLFAWYPHRGSRWE